MGEVPGGQMQTLDQELHYDSEVNEERIYSRYLNVFSRTVEHPPRPLAAEGRGDEARTDGSSRVVEYDVVGAKLVDCRFCIVLPYDSKRKLFTLVREYSQGANHMIYGAPSGGLSPSHKSMEDCAIAELSEEVHLRGGQLVRLLPPSHPGLMETKWCRNRGTPFLVIDAEEDPNPCPKDFEEFIEVLHLSLDHLRQIMYSGNMLPPSIVTCAMAIQYLESHGLL